MTLVLLILLLAAAVIPGKNSRASVSAPPTIPPRQMPPLSHGLILPTFPVTATQADRGAVIWQLVCQDCHGDRGQGLTAEWRLTWATEDQNCWQSRCHALNHLPEGFVLPSYIPPVNNLLSTGQFANAADLHQFIRTRMPWQNPGNLQEDEYWQATAMVLRLNGRDPGSLSLDEDSAGQILLGGQATKPASTLTPETSATVTVGVSRVVRDTQSAVDQAQSTPPSVPGQIPGPLVIPGLVLLCGIGIGLAAWIRRNQAR